MLDFKDKKVVVIGLGVSGAAVSKFLAGRGARVFASDSDDRPKTREKAEELRQLAVNVELGGHTKRFFENAGLIVISPGVDITDRRLSGVIPADIPVIGELELAYNFCPAPVIAITGTNGKSTTTELIGSILKRAGLKVKVCGNIGEPFISVVDELDRDSVAVVEVSSFQLESIIRFKPYIAVLLNITEDHYDRHEGYNDYKRMKFRIFENQDRDDWAVMRSDLAEDILSEKVASKKVYFNTEGILARGDEPVRVKDISRVDISTTELKGRHNLENIISSVIVSGIMGLSEEDIESGLKSFKGLRHRFEDIGSKNGVQFIDDSKATNIDATKRALESLPRKTILIAGGRDKGGDYRAIAGLVESKVKTVVVLGEARDKISAAYGEIVPVISADSMRDAVKKAISCAVPGDMVLLSPMCSSFDMFEDYKDRGDAFRREVFP